MSSPTPEQWTAMQKLVQSFYQKPDAEPFREPVDWKTMGLYDYPQIIKKPMDLGTIKKHIVDRKYKTLQEAADDVRLVWTNCMTYNADGSDFYILAQTLNKKWQEKLKKLMEDLRVKDGGGAAAGGSDPVTSGAAGAGGAAGASTVSAGSSNKLTLDEKRAFAKSLYKISKDELGRILVEIEKKHPAALVRNSAEDEVELNVDKIPSPLFAELQQYVKSVMGGSTGSKPKKKSNSVGGGGGKRQKAST